MPKNKPTSTFIKTLFGKYNIIFLWQLILTIVFLAEICLVDYYPFVRWEIHPFYLLLGIFALVLLQFIIIRFRIIPEHQIIPYNIVKDKNYLIIILLFLIFCYIFHANGGARFSIDDKKYYSYVKSLVIDGDLDFQNEYKQFGVRDNYHLFHRTKAGRPPNLYPPGSMALWLPFFILIHLLLKAIALFDPGLLTNGLIQSYKNAVGLATIFYACLAFLIIYRMAKDYVKRSLVLVSVLLFILSAFLIYYIIFAPLMSTVCEAFMATLFIFFWLKQSKSKSISLQFIFGLTGGLLIFIRTTLGIFLILPLIDTIKRFFYSKNYKSWSSIKRNLWLSIYLLIGVILGAAPLLMVWKAVYGEWIVSFSRYFPWLTSPYIMQVLFSWRHGLISWSPIILFSLLGLLILTFKHKHIGLGFIAIFLLTLYINSSTTAWHGDGAFGARRFASMACIFSFGLAFFLQWIQSTLGKKGLLIIVIFFSFLIPWNLLLLYQFEENLIIRRALVRPAIMLKNDKTILLKQLPEALKLSFCNIKALSLGIPAKQYQRLKTSRAFAADFHINIGAEDELYIGKNWAEKEFQEDINFRWSLRGFSTLLFSLREPSSYLLVINCWPFSYPNSHPQSITLKINGIRLQAISLQNHLRKYNILIPREYLRIGINEIAIYSAYSMRPSSLSPNPDTRKLSVSFDYFSFKSVKYPQ